MLLKTDEQTINVLNITKQKLLMIANGAECLSTKLDNFITNNNINYRKLQTSRISRSCQTMSADNPTLLNSSSQWRYEDTVLLENWMAGKPSTDGNNTSFSEGNSATEELKNLQCDKTQNFEILNEVQENLLSSNNNNNDNNNQKTNLIDPVIKIDGDFIEVEYFSEDNQDPEIGIDDDDSIANNDINNYENLNHQECLSLNNKSPENKPPKIPQYKIADNKGLSPMRFGSYKDFLVKSHEDNCNSHDVNDNVDDNAWGFDKYIPKTIECYQFDQHRPLSQSANDDADNNKEKNNLLKEEKSITFERVGSSRIKRNDKDDFKSELKSFLSFRCPSRKNKSDKNIRKKYVTSEEGPSGPIWPAVLLTFDKGISSGSSENN